MKNDSVVVATYIAVYSRLNLVFGVKCFSQVHCKKWLKKDLYAIQYEEMKSSEGQGSGCRAQSGNQSKVATDQNGNASVSSYQLYAMMYSIHIYINTYKCC